MVFSSNKVESSLKKKGFIQEPGDHKYFVFYCDGKRSKIRTKVSHNGQDIGDSLIKCMSKQVHLNKSDFADLINCPLSKEEYTKKMKDEKNV
ncbi:hypothetical protein SAMN02910355_1829 [Terrisporobacter glycolicus]|nr:hypothetical protein SAMN02910355_1829 [Terrisporobacter glycolicus]